MVDGADEGGAASSGSICLQTTPVRSVGRIGRGTGRAHLLELAEMKAIDEMSVEELRASVFVSPLEPSRTESLAAGTHTKRC